ncbi:MAG: glycogen synthase [Rhabdochlamydiaceae bacterium]|nr:glycogen synthase [Rhabdochlamydiaceae bacterium]
MIHVIQIASELAPIAKVGGLGDVIYGLSKELVRLNHKVEIVLPKYDSIPLDKLKDLRPESPHVNLEINGVCYSHTIWSAYFEDLKLLLIESLPPANLFNRGMIYGCADDLERFSIFSAAALGFIRQREQAPDVLHLHDWPSALIAVLQQETYDKQSAKTLLTIHNLEHQAKCPPSLLTSLGLKQERVFTRDKMQDPVATNLANILKGGIIYSDAITTVSPNYQQEILTVEGGCGLHETLIAHQHKLSGILNGIDEEFWDPEKDPLLTRKYATHRVREEEQLTELLAGKQENRRHLCKILSIRPSNAPLVCSITRLVPQKSPRLLKAALLRTLEKGGQFILLGTTQIPEIQQEFEQLRQDLKANPDVALIFENDETLAHLIFAAADMFIIPSLFEPCGLTQLIALRYGTIPIARVTGGLADTVFDIDTSSKPSLERNGFTFEHPDEQGVYWALDRALKLYTDDRSSWRTLIKQGIGMDFSWRHATPQYVMLYKKLLNT